MTSYRDDPAWQEAHAAFLNPGAVSDSEAMAVRIAAAVRMHDIERALEAQAGR